MLTKIIDRNNEREALGSFYYAGNTMDTVRAILNNNRRKEALINAKVIVDNALASMKPALRRVLELRFLKRMKCEDIAKEDGISLRNVFRRQSLALHAFTKYCIMKGYDSDWLEERYGKEQIFVKYNERYSANVAIDEDKEAEATDKTSSVDVNSCRISRFAPTYLT